MTGADVDDLALLWQAEPSAAERREFRGLADKAERKAQFVQYAEHGLGFLLFLATLMAMFMAPAPATIAIGLVSIGALGWSSWKRHLLAQIALMMATSDRRELIGQAIERAAANLRRSTIGLCLFLPGLLLGALLTHSFNRGGDLDAFGSVLLRGAQTWPEGPIAVALLAIIAAQLIRTNLQLSKELRRLRGLQEEYREEARLDAFMLGRNSPQGPAIGALTK